MAYEIVKRLRQKDQQQILNLLADDVSASDRKAGKLHQVFRDSFDAKEIMSDKMMLKKLNYMHSILFQKNGSWRVMTFLICTPVPDIIRQKFREYLS